MPASPWTHFHNDTKPCRTAAIVEAETALVRRFHALVQGGLASVATDQGGRQVLCEFLDTFVDAAHLPRVESILSRCGAAGDRRLELWLGKLGAFQDRIRNFLEGLNRSRDLVGPGADTSFGWSLAALRGELGRYLDWAEHGLLPELRVRVKEELDHSLLVELGLDDSRKLSIYAQAECLLMTLEGWSSSAGPDLPSDAL